MSSRASLFFAALLISAHQPAFADDGGASPNAIPPECAPIARQFVIRGSYDSSDLGARLWDIDKLREARADDEGSNRCLDATWQQAMKDQAAYWRHIGEKYGCQASENKPAAQVARQCQSVALNLRYLRVSSDIHDHAVALGPRPDRPCAPVVNEVSPQAYSLASDAMNAVKKLEDSDTQPEQQPPRQPGAVIASGITDDALMACKRADSSWEQVGYGCVKGLFEGIGSNLRDTVMGLWDTSKLVLKSSYKLSKAGWDMLEQLCGTGSIAGLAREWHDDAMKVMEKLAVAVASLPGVILDKIHADQSFLHCASNAERCELGAKMVSYLGLDALTLLPASPLFVGKLAAKAGEAVGGLESVQKLSEAARAAKAATIEAGGAAWARNLSALEDVTALEKQIFSKAPKIFHDISNGYDVIASGTRIFVRKVGINRLFEVTSDALKKRFQIALARVGLGGEEARQVAAANDAAKAAKGAARLPSKLKDSELANKADGFAENPKRFVKASRKEAKQMADFLGLEQEEWTDAGRAGKFYLKDASGEKRYLYRIQMPESGSVFIGKLGEAAEGADTFAVSLPIPAKDLGSRLSDVVADAAKSGAKSYEVGGSVKTLGSADRLKFSFDNEAAAKAFQEAWQKKLAQPTLIQRIKRVPFAASKLGFKAFALETYKQCGTRPDCTCQLFYNAGLNPADGKDAQVSPFHCGKDGVIPGADPSEAVFPGQ